MQVQTEKSVKSQSVQKAIVDPLQFRKAEAMFFILDGLVSQDEVCFFNKCIWSQPHAATHIS